jgi:hypothetical protein
MDFLRISAKSFDIHLSAALSGAINMANHVIANPPEKIAIQM